MHAETTEKVEKVEAKVAKVEAQVAEMNGTMSQLLALLERQQAAAQQHAIDNLRTDEDQSHSTTCS